MTTAMNSSSLVLPPKSKGLAGGGLINPEDISKPIGLERELSKKEKAELLSYLQEEFNAARSARLQFERQWFLNMAFYFGRQYASWVSPGSSINYTRLYEPPVPPWRVRLVVNKIRVIIRTELSKLTKERPRGYVIPSTSDDEDLAGARAAEAIYDHLYRELKLPENLKQALFWSTITGNGFTKDWFDPNSFDASNQKGTINCENVSPFHLYVPTITCTDIEDQPWVTHSMAKDPGYIDKNYEKKLSPDTTGAGGQLEERFLNALGVQSGGKKNLVAIKETWIKPCNKFKEGSLITWTDGEILAYFEGWPLESSDYPFTKFDSIPTGRFYSDSAIVDLIPLQKEYNRTRSQIIEAQNRMAKPQLSAPRGSIDANKITSEPGLVVFYTPGFNKPEPIPLMPLPAYVIQNLQQTQADLDDISGQHEITKGKTPPGVEAASAISYLQDEDDSKLKLAVDSIEAGVEKIGKHLLIHVQQHWDAERQIKVTGVNNSFEVFAFSKADLRDNTDFRVEEGSAIPKSRAAKQAFIMELGKMGWIPPQQALRYLDMAETGKLYEEAMVDVRQAQRENLMLAKGLGDLVKLNSFDEHIIHIHEHDTYRKQQSYEVLDDQLKTIFEQHVQQHKQTLCLQYGRAFHPGDPAMDGFIRMVMTGQVNALQTQQPVGSGLPAGNSPGGMQ